MTTKETDPVALHSLRSAARHCGVAPGTVRNWVLTGALRARRGNGRIYILQADLERVAAEARGRRRARGKVAS